MRTNLVKKKDTKSPLNDGMLDMVIAFDTTGSMCAYIEVVKLNIKKLIPWCECPLQYKLKDFTAY